MQLQTRSIAPHSSLLHLIRLSGILDGHPLKFSQDAVIPWSDPYSPETSAQLYERPHIHSRFLTLIRSHHDSLASMIHHYTCRSFLVSAAGIPRSSHSPLRLKGVGATDPA